MHLFNYGQSSSLQACMKLTIKVIYLANMTPCYFPMGRVCEHAPLSVYKNENGLNKAGILRNDEISHLHTNSKSPVDCSVDTK